MRITARTSPAKRKRGQKQDQARMVKSIGKYQPLVLGMARRYFPNPADQQDVLQEVALRLQTVRTRLNPSRNIKGLIAIITANVCRDTLRKRRRKPVNQLPADFVESLTTDLRRCRSEQQGPEKQLLTREQVEQAKAAMQKLQPKDRTILVLAQAQLPYNEIAGIVGIPVGTIRSRIHHVRQRLLKILGKDFFEE